MRNQILILLSQADFRGNDLTRTSTYPISVLLSPFIGCSVLLTSCYIHSIITHIIWWIIEQWTVSKTYLFSFPRKHEVFVHLRTCKFGFNLLIWKSLVLSQSPHLRGWELLVVYQYFLSQKVSWWSELVRNNIPM